MQYIYQYIESRLSGVQVLRLASNSVQQEFTAFEDTIQALFGVANDFIVLDERLAVSRDESFQILQPSSKRVSIALFRLNRILNASFPSFQFLQSYVCASERGSVSPRQSPPRVVAVHHRRPRHAPFPSASCVCDMTKVFVVVVVVVIARVLRRVVLRRVVVCRRTTPVRVPETITRGVLFLTNHDLSLDPPQRPRVMTPQITPDATPSLDDDHGLARRRHIAPHARTMLAAHTSSFVRGDTTASLRAKRAEGKTAAPRRAIEAKESRIGKVPVAVPKGVTYTLKDNMLSVKVRSWRASRVVVDAWEEIRRVRWGGRESRVVVVAPGEDDARRRARKALKWNRVFVGRDARAPDDGRH